VPEEASGEAFLDLGDVLGCSDRDDLGPEGGEAGGEIVAVGTPEDVAQVQESFTGEFLRHVLPAAETEVAAA